MVAGFFYYLEIEAVSSFEFACLFPTSRMCHIGVFGIPPPLICLKLISFSQKPCDILLSVNRLLVLIRNSIEVQNSLKAFHFVSRDQAILK